MISYFFSLIFFPVFLLVVNEPLNDHTVFLWNQKFDHSNNIDDSKPTTFHRVLYVIVGIKNF